MTAVAKTNLRTHAGHVRQTIARRYGLGLSGQGMVGYQTTQRRHAVGEEEVLLLQAGPKVRVTGIREM